jgi:uncharacterized protein (TIGR02145 family)
MKTFSLSLMMALWVLLMQAQLSNAHQPEQDSLRLTEIQTINLNQGWSGISSYLDPANPEVALLMAAIEDQLIILRDFDGNFYQPSTKETLINWDFKKGYFIKMASAESLEIEGLYTLSKQLNLQAGWNLIPVLSEMVVSIEEYFFDHLDKVEIVTEVAGLNVYWPAMEVFTLQQVIPGKAYLMKTTAPFALFQFPEVITADVTAVTATSASCGGEVLIEGSSSVTARGVVWSILQNPTIYQNEGITFDGEGTGSWVSELVELTPETTYFIRAYATNSVGIGYGEVISFETNSNSFVCGNGTVTDYDGNIYNTVAIGNQCWMSSNLKTTTYSNGTAIEYPGNDNSAWSSNTTGAYAWYNNDLSWKDIYGALYNGYAVSNANGLCPAGWHIPDDQEWTQLTDYIGGTADPNGNRMKSCRQVGSPLGDSCNVGSFDHPLWHSNLYHWGTDDYGFTGLAAGLRQSFGGYANQGQLAQWWSSTEYSPGYVWIRILYYHRGYFERDFGSVQYGRPVRCIRDQ